MEKTKISIFFLLDELYKCVKAQVEQKGAKTITLQHSTLNGNSPSSETVGNDRSMNTCIKID